MAKKRRPTRTLFDPDYLRRLSSGSMPVPYFAALELLEINEDRRFVQDELYAFLDAATDEAGLYQSRGFLAGPVVLSVRGTQDRTYECVKDAIAIPPWVESDTVNIDDCEAEYVILVEHSDVFQILCELKVWSSIPTLLVTGVGIPRAATRRLLHRLSVEYQLPVYVLTDNDTWGYFLFSLLKRGALAPHAVFPHLSVTDTRYLGLRAGDANRYSMPNDCLRAWKPNWDIRLIHMQDYACFRDDRWKEEFDRFALQRAGISLQRAFAACGGPAMLQQVIVRRLEQETWLT